MAFDKDAYRKRREAGKRGQGDREKAPLIPFGLGSNRKRYRMKLRKRFKKDPYDPQDIGKPYTKKGVRHRNGRKPFEPEFNPKVSNHERVFRQRLKSGRYKRTTKGE